MVADIERLTSELACMARACGNWREWNEKTATGEIVNWDDWKVAARAILERDQLKETVAGWVQIEEERDQAIKLLRALYAQIGNHAAPSRRHAVTPGLRDEVRDYLLKNGGV